MQDRKVRLAFFSLGGSSYRQIEMGWLTFVFSLLLCIALLFGAAAAAVWSFSSFYQKRQLAAIERDHQKLRQNLKLWEQRVRQMAAGVNGVEPQVVNEADLDDLSKSPLPSQLVVLDAEDNIDPVVSMETQPEAKPDIMVAASPATDFLSRLEADFRQNREIQKEIADRFEKDPAQAEHLPTIGPLVRGHITDLFGKRSDPFHSRTRHHNGIDIGAPYGREVYAPAAGVVEMVKLKYTKGRGYGKAVLINHGYGVKTLYGHLMQVDVKYGEKVDRWKVIGRVGATGRATGPHLHYEVWVNGKAKDPLQYILNQGSLAASKDSADQLR